MRHASLLALALALALAVGCAPGSSGPVVTVSSPTSTTLVGATEISLDVVVTGDPCAPNAKVAVTAGTFTATLTPGTPVTIPVTQLVATPYADPTAPQQVPITLVASCPVGDEGTLEGPPLVHTLTLTAATASAADRPFNPAKLASHWFDTAGRRVSTSDGSGLFLLGNEGNAAVSITPADVPYSTTAPAIRRLFTAGPAIAGNLPFAAEATGDDNTKFETVVGARNASGEVFHVTVKPDGFGFGTIYAAAVNSATSTIYAVLPNRRLIAANAAGVRWDAALSAGNFTPANIRLGAATGAAVRSAALVGSTFTVQDYRTDGQPEGLPDTLEATGTVAAWDLANARFLWFFDATGFHLYEPYTDDCAVPFPAGRKLSAPENKPRFDVTTSPGGAQVLAYFATESAAGGTVTHHLMTVDASCAPVTVDLPAAGLATGRPALYLANDGRAFVGGSEGASIFATGLTAPARTLPTTLGSFAYRCGESLCVFDGAGQPVSVPFAP